MGISMLDSEAGSCLCVFSVIEAGSCDQLLRVQPIRVRDSDQLIQSLLESRTIKPENCPFGLHPDTSKMLHGPRI